MTPFALGVIADLRKRRLLPVAVLLLIAVVALPFVALKPADEPAATPTANTAATANQVPAGLPSPQQALSDKPLVSLAVLDESSDLGEFESKNPFKPIDQVASSGASSGSDTSAPTTIPTDAGGSTGGGGSDTGTGGGTGGGGGGGTTPQTTPKQDDGGGTPKTEKKLTYSVDLAIRGPKGLRRYTGVPKLSLLPSQDNPLFVFLGVEDAGTKAVFLVDAKLKSVDGEGICTPSAAECATLALAPGERHELANDQGQTWTIQIGEVRETSVAKAAAAARAAQTRRTRRSTTPVGDTPAPRFIPPIITDLFTGGRS